MIGAGTDTTANTLMILIYYLAKDDEEKGGRYERLVNELHNLSWGKDGDEKVSLLGLEKGRWLEACILEGLRWVYFVFSLYFSWMLGAGAERCWVSFFLFFFIYFLPFMLFFEFHHYILRAFPSSRANDQWQYSLSYGVTTRLARIAPNEVLKFQDWEIPAGVSFPSSSYIKRFPLADVIIDRHRLE